MLDRLEESVGRWAATLGIDPRALPSRAALAARFGRLGSGGPCRDPAPLAEVAAWERRHGFALPRGLRAWLLVSDGFYLGGPIIHPLTAIGPMVPFARMPDLLIQPESWFELGNPNVETVCIDLAYRWPGGDRPLFTSGDDQTGSPPRVIAPSFEGWFLDLLREGGREYWFDRGHASLGHPWREHRRRSARPALPDRLYPLVHQARALIAAGADDRSIALALEVGRADVERIFRHVQHGAAEVAPARSESGAA